MRETWTLESLGEDGLGLLAGLLAFWLRRGDVVLLKGDLGAGKTTLARGLVRAVLDDEAAEVPSPTFALMNAYETGRLAVVHADLYRLADPQEVDELGLDEAVPGAAIVVEWPERAEGRWSTGDRLEIALDEAADAERRDLTLCGIGEWAQRLGRLRAAYGLVAARYPGARVRYLQGDASPRRYARIEDQFGASALLMDAPRQPDGPAIRAGLPYSRIAHLAEDVRPFLAVAQRLAASGFSVPRILEHDMADGLLVVEDLGDGVFGSLLGSGAGQLPTGEGETQPDIQAELWRAATEVLVALRAVQVPGVLPLPDGTSYRMPRYDRGALEIEIELLADWYWPYRLGGPMPEEVRRSFLAAWAQPIATVLQAPPGWVLRDVHSPNLIWLPQRIGVARVGLIDFQDALAGHPAYDLVSLLQDARLDVPVSLERELLAAYCQAAAAREDDFDSAAFTYAYAVLGAQRATKILGIFARLAKRDGKPQYLRHIPRLWGYLERNLAHEGLGALRGWYDMHVPATARDTSSQV